MRFLDFSSVVQQLSLIVDNNYRFPLVLAIYNLIIILLFMFEKIRSKYYYKVAMLLAVAEAPIILYFWHTWQACKRLDLVFVYFFQK